jgi:hypothetical protein
MAYDLSSALSPVSMTLLVTVARKSSPRALDTSPGVPGPHAFAVRIDIARLTISSASTAPRLAFVTTRTPLMSRRDARKYTHLSDFRKEEIRRNELAAQNALNQFTNFDFPNYVLGASAPNFKAASGSNRAN